MGFFSWLTADTRQSIANSASERPTQTVYLLLPDGQEPIREDEYEGYGVFGGMDAYDWLARANIPAERLKGLSEDDVREMGVTLDCGNYYVDTQDGSKHTIFHKGSALIDPEIKVHLVTYDTPIPHFDGATGNELIASGRLIKRMFAIEKPLKFSHNPDAKYEELSASPSCPDQGFFYEE